MSTIRNGKIARLPPEIREQLNQRLAKHESSTPLAKWLNSLPEVRTILAEEFGDKTVGKQNLHEWRHGGFKAWLEQKEAQEMMRRIFADGHELIGAAQGAPADKMAAWVTARYLASARAVTGRAGEDEQGWKRLRELCHDVVSLQRAELRTKRLEFEREQAGVTTEKHCRARLMEHFMAKLQEGRGKEDGGLQ